MVGEWVLVVGLSILSQSEHPWLLAWGGCSDKGLLSTLPGWTIQGLNQAWVHIPWSWRFHNSSRTLSAELLQPHWAG